MSSIYDQILNKINYKTEDPFLKTSLDDLLGQYAIEKNIKSQQQKNIVELLPAQRQFMSAEEAIILFRGGIRSGKTWIGAWWSITKCLNGESVLAIAPTYQMLIDNMVSTLIMICEQYNIPYNLNMSMKKFSVGSSYILFRTAEKYDAIRGFEVCHMWFDEISFTPYSEKAYKRAIGRMSGMKTGIGQSAITSSPNGLDFATDLSEQDDCKLIVQKITDNWTLNPSYIKRLMSEYKGKYGLQELNAEIVDWGGSFFDISGIKIIEPTDFANEAQAFDLAFTKNKGSDYSAHGIGGALFNGDFAVRSAEQWKSKVPTTKKKIIDIVTNKYPDVNAWIEANGTQVSVYDDLIFSGIAINPIRNLNKGKVTRMFPMAQKMEAGEFCLFSTNQTNEAIKNQARRFSLDDSHKNDDLLDAINHVYIKTCMFGQSGFAKTII